MCSKTCAVAIPGEKDIEGVLVNRLVYEYDPQLQTKGQHWNRCSLQNYNNELSSEGGTLDVTVHEITEENKVREIHHASGGDFGGLKVNAAFESFLDTLFGEEFIRKFKDKHPTDWLETMNDFEIKKRAGRVLDGTTRIRLSCNFIKSFESLHEGASCRDIITENYPSGDVKLSSSEYLCMAPRIMQEFFEPVITEILDHLNDLLQKDVLSEVGIIFLVGGFAQSPALQSHMRSEFEDSYHILIPTEAKTAVLRGAVMFGQNSTVVEERILSETYGTGCYRKFRETYDDPSKKEVIDGKVTCKDVFRVLASADELIHIGDCRRISSFCPLRKTQKYVGFHFYSTAKTNVRYVTDDGVKLLSTVTVASPDNFAGRKVELNLYFGGTEIKVTAVDLESKNAETVFLDFLRGESN